MKITSKAITKYFLRPAVCLSLIAISPSCDKDDDDPQDPTLQSETYEYEFNNGQVVAAAAYDGMHMDNLMAELVIEEMEDGGSRVTVTLMNTIDGESYPVHTHDAADPANTPNNTPYNESPNSNILVQTAQGNGGTVSVSQETDRSFEDLTTTYEGFFVVHDPLQPVNTADISTYLVVGSFARTQSETGYESMTYSYDFNTGQAAPVFAYSGSHADDLNAQLKVQELAEGSRVSVTLMNSMDGETYPTHAHDKADAATTPNGTPYDETPNGDVLVVNVNGTGGDAYASQLSSMSYTDLTTTYEAFFVVHDPLQAVNTADPTTYVVLGDFARE